MARGAHGHVVHGTQRAALARRARASAGQARTCTRARRSRGRRRERAGITVSDHEMLRGRSIRTLSWLGDAFFEHEVRVRIALRGDLPLDRLDLVKAMVVRAESQAQMLAVIEPELADDEASTARRARNTSPPSSARGRRNTKSYRAAS